MNIFELEQSVKKSGLAPVYAVLGEEDELRDQAIRVLKEAAARDGELGDFNLDVLYGDETEASELLGRVNEAPVFAPRRVVIVKAADKLPARETERLVPYLKAPCEWTTLILVASKLDGRTQFAQAVKQSASVIDCGPLPDGRLPAWVRAEATRLGLRLDDAAVSALKDLAATTSLGLVKRELEKLTVYVGERRMATAADVETMRGSEAGASVFDLVAAIGAGDRPRVLRILARNLEAGEAPLRMLGSLVWQYRQLWKAKEAIGAGKEGEAARVLRVPPFKVRQFIAPFSDGHLRTAFERFAETDSKLKGGSAGAPALILEALVLKLCTLARSRPAPSRPNATAPATSGTATSRTIRTVRPSSTR